MFFFEKLKDAYLFSANKYHEFKEQIYNDHHPERPVDSGWKCSEEFQCTYKPEIPTKTDLEIISILKSLKHP
jgi:hypothetical protein